MGRANDDNRSTEKFGQRMLSRTNLIRTSYRSLINHGRSYAAFNDTHDFLFKKTAHWFDKTGITNRIVLDPMSGYGGTAFYCNKYLLNSFSIEINRPQFLWQTLFLPENVPAVRGAISALVAGTKLPATTKIAEASDEFFTDEAIDILSDILQQIHGTLNASPRAEFSTRNIALGLILPFVSRLACYSDGDAASHVRTGGICVYKGYQEDWRTYLESMLACLPSDPSGNTCTNRLVYGDARTFVLNDFKFNCMITSPPYPNSRDFNSIFKIENIFLDIIAKRVSNLEFKCAADAIGSVFVKGKGELTPKSETAMAFLMEAEKISANQKRSDYDHKMYYKKYFSNYFYELERAYENISTVMDDKFEGYIVVVDNTHRGIRVPVGQVVRDVWERLGFETALEKSTEQFHVGTKNPRARGSRAKHTEYIVRVER